jgi:hypothetical protein
MEPFMEPSGSGRALEASVLDAFAAKDLGFRLADVDLPFLKMSTEPTQTASGVAARPGRECARQAAKEEEGMAAISTRRHPPSVRRSLWAGPPGWLPTNSGEPGAGSWIDSLPSATTDGAFLVARWGATS